MDSPRRAWVDDGAVGVVDERDATRTPGATGASGPRVAAAEPVRVTGLTKRFGSVLAVDDLSFEVRPGRVTGFLGPNGAGKTTTLRMLVGLVTPTSGTATFGTTPYAAIARPQQRVGCVLEASFHPGRTGRDHLRVLAQTAGLGSPDRIGSKVDELLALVGLADAGRRRAGTYSLGMRQRLALAGALLGDPDHLILDEPANGLDPEGIRWLRGFLRAFAATGRTVLVSSHLLSEVQATVDDVVIIGRGRLLHQSPVAELGVGQDTVRVRVRHLGRARQALADHDITATRERDAAGEFLRVQGSEPATVGHLLFDAGLPVYELTREGHDLERQFFAMVEDAERATGARVGAR